VPSFEEWHVTGQGREMTTHFTHEFNMRGIEVHKHQATSGCTAFWHCTPGHCLDISQLENTFLTQLLNVLLYLHGLAPVFLEV
jgi:hypothetical protein